VAYDARRQFTLLDKAQTQARQLEVEFERLKTEQQSQATPLRVEKAAREKLGMRSASPRVTHYVSGDGLTAPSTSSAAQEVPQELR
jgi:cell division protein FtsL